MSADEVIKAHERVLKEGTDKARALAQTLLNVPYGEGDGEKLDVYIPSTNSLGAFLISGIYDLLPIVSTYVNEPLKMTEEVAIRNSPTRLVQQLKSSSSGCHIIVAVAEHDSPEFRKQSEEYYKMLEASGLNVTLEDVPNTDHFNITERLVDGEYYLTKVLLKIMGKC